MHLPRASQDDTGIAGAAEKALLAYLHTQPPAAFADLLCGSSTAATQLAELSGSRSATQRMRAFALLVQAAAGSRSHAEQLKQAGGVDTTLLNPVTSLCTDRTLPGITFPGPNSPPALLSTTMLHAAAVASTGVVHQLLEQLNPRDPLACLVALQLLQVGKGRGRQLPSHPQHPGLFTLTCSSLQFQCKHGTCPVCLSVCLPACMLACAV